MVPKLYMSAAVVQSLPAICSGAAHRKVPVLLAVLLGPSTNLLRPTSPMRAEKSDASRMLGLLRSK